MINKLPNINSDTRNVSVYNYNDYNIQDLLNRFYTKINENVDVANTSLDFLEWLKSEGLPLETQKELTLMFNDGRLENLINDGLLNDINLKVDKNVNEVINLKKFLNYMDINGGGFEEDKEPNNGLDGGEF